MNKYLYVKLFLILITILLLFSVVSVYSMPINSNLKLLNGDIRVLIKKVDNRYIVEVFTLYMFEVSNVNNKVTIYYVVPEEVCSLNIYANGKPAYWNSLNKTIRTISGEYKVLSINTAYASKRLVLISKYSYYLNCNDKTVKVLYLMNYSNFILACNSKIYIEFTTLFPVKKYVIQLGNKVIKCISLNNEAVKDKLIMDKIRNVLFYIEPSSSYVFKTSKDVYELYEPVKIIFKNNNHKVIYLPNPSPWKIVDGSGKVVYKPFALGDPIPVKPGESLEWVWTQEVRSGFNIHPGVYKVILKTLNGVELTYTFKIKTSLYAKSTLRNSNIPLISGLAALFLILVIVAMKMKYRV